MKANELRIGNIIQCALNESLRLPDGFPRVVSAVLPFGEVIVDLSPTSPTTIKCPINHCSGIPLTTEWLLKFGFEHSRDGKELCIDIFTKGARFHLDFCNGKILLQNRYDGRHGDVKLNELPHIKYVHQLQNLYFALTGEELIIKP